jgi:hypothetical protein
MLLAYPPGLYKPSATPSVMSCPGPGLDQSAQVSPVPTAITDWAQSRQPLHRFQIAGGNYMPRTIPIC